MDDYIVNVGNRESWIGTVFVYDLMYDFAKSVGAPYSVANILNYGRRYNCTRGKCNGLKVLLLDQTTHNMYHDGTLEGHNGLYNYY